MRRILEEIGNTALFHNLTGVHQRYPIGVLAHQSQIVRDQQKGNAVLFCSSRSKSRICA